MFNVTSESSSPLEIKTLKGKIKYRGNVFEPDERAVEYPFVLKHLPKTVGVKILDVGASQTPFLLLLQIMSYEAYGLDKIPYDVTFDKPWLPINFIEADLFNVSLPKNSFDFVICISTLEHLNFQPKDMQKDRKALERFYKWLKPKGYLLLTVPTGTPCTIRQNVQIYDLGSLLEMLWQIGFVPVTVENHIAENFTWKVAPYDPSINPSVTKRIGQNSCIKAMKP